MWKWFADLWTDVKGNVKYAVLYWLLIGGGFSSVLAVVYGLWKTLAHRPATTLDLFIAPILPLTVTGVCGLLLAIRERKPTLNIEFSQHSDNDESAYLEVKNQGETINISARVEIVGLSTGRGFKTRPFEGQWKNENTSVDFYNQQPEFVAGEVQIEPNKSRLLGIASIASMVGMPIQEMAIVGINDEGIGWESNPKQSQELPYFIVRVTLVAKGYPKTKEVTYRVGPKTSHGPFQMTEVV